MNLKDLFTRKPKPPESSQVKSWVIIVVALATAIIVGGGIYLWQQNVLKDLKIERIELEQKIDALENGVEKMEKPSKQITAKDLKVSGWSSYTNYHYGFSIDYPPEYNFCLNDFCWDEAIDKQIQYVKLWGNNANETDYSLEIKPGKNELGKSAIEFGKEQAIGNRVDGYLVDGTEGMITFAGQSAYKFDVKKAFGFGGFEWSYDKGMQTYLAALSEPKNGFSSGHVVKGTHRAVYFEKDGNLYILTYPIDKTFEKIVRSFHFIK